MRRRRFLPVLAGGPGVIGVAVDDESVVGVGNVAEEPSVLFTAERFSVWIRNCGADMNLQ